MAQVDLAEYAREHFFFLATEYGFWETEVSGMNYARWIRFTSHSCRVCISQEFDRIFASIGPTPNIMSGPIVTHTLAGDPVRQEIQYDLSFIIGFKDKTFDLTNIKMDGYDENPTRAINRDLPVLAGRLKNYCDDMLGGDFSIVPALDRWLEEYMRVKLGLK